MLPSEKIDNERYQNLGKLFYAIAMADKNVRLEEIKKLKAAVRDNWVPIDEVKDEFGSDAAYQIEIVFDWLQQEEKDGAIYFLEFTEFFKAHPSRFNTEIKQLVWTTAEAIAAAFSGKNKSELIILAKLKLLLKSA
jgi:hypothetical protein